VFPKRLTQRAKRHGAELSTRRRSHTWGRGELDAREVGFEGDATEIFQATPRVGEQRTGEDHRLRMEKRSFM
jgi:hypothetical protein